MHFKTDMIQFQFEWIHPRLRAYLLELDKISQMNCGKEIYITCLDRDAVQNISVGGKQASYHLLRPCCAADLRAHADSYYDPGQMAWLKSYFNKYLRVLAKDKFLIEDDKQCIHIQIEPTDWVREIMGEVAQQEGGTGVQPDAPPTPGVSG